MADLQSVLGREDVDLVVIDTCDDVEMVYEIVNGVPIVGSEDTVLMVRTMYISRYLDFIESLKLVKKVLQK